MDFYMRTRSSKKQFAPPARRPCGEDRLRRGSTRSVRRPRPRPHRSADAPISRGTDRDDEGDRRPGRSRAEDESLARLPIGFATLAPRRRRDGFLYEDQVLKNLFAPPARRPCGEDRLRRASTRSVRRPRPRPHRSADAPISRGTGRDDEGDRRLRLARATVSVVRARRDSRHQRCRRRHESRCA
jgi:hypothetical protein